ncbi:MAG: biopolymer transporter ExbD [Candidatus Babeliales bacterium]
MTRLRRKKRTAFAVPEISLTPLIDTALTLLIIFMITTPVVQHSLDMQLPKGGDKNNVSQACIVSLGDQQELFLNNKGYSTREWEDFAREIEATMNMSFSKKVFIKADAARSYGDVITLVDKIKKIPQVQMVALSTSPALEKR